MDPDMKLKWSVVKGWGPDARYRDATTKQEADNLLDAVSDPHHGVLQWLQRYW
jgi:hypothetical protein